VEGGGIDSLCSVFPRLLAFIRCSYESFPYYNFPAQARKSVETTELSDINESCCASLPFCQRPRTDMPSSPPPPLRSVSPSRSHTTDSSSATESSSRSRNPLPAPVFLPPSSIVDLTLSPPTPAGPTAAQKGKGRALSVSNQHNKGGSTKRAKQDSKGAGSGGGGRGEFTMLGKKRRVVPIPPEDGEEGKEGVERLEEYSK
jgi:hypothetical protein